MDELTQNQNVVALADKAMTQDLAEAHEAMGMIKAFTFVGKLATVATLKKLLEVKEAKNFKGLQYINTEGQLATVATWEDFCIACGTSRRKVDEDLQNLNYFGSFGFLSSLREQLS